MQTILETARQAEFDDASAKDALWLELVSDAVTGVERDRDDIVSTLKECGRTAADLERAIASFKQRQVWQQQRTDGLAAEGEIGRIGDEVSALAAECERQVKAIKDSFDAQIGEQRGKLPQLQAAVLHGNTALVKLLESLPAEFKTRLEPLLDKHARLMRERAQVEGYRISEMNGGSLTGAKDKAYKAQLADIEDRLKQNSAAMQVIEAEGCAA